MNPLLQGAFIAEALTLFAAFLFTGVIGNMFGLMLSGLMAFLGTGGAYRPDDE